MNIENHRSQQHGSDLHKKVITKGIHYASGNISNLQDLCTFLIEKGVLTTDEFEQITKKVTRKEQCRSLLLIFEFKSKASYEALMAGFMETINKHVADEFERIEQELRFRAADENQLC